MTDSMFILVYFFYGLAFFSMGLVVLMEGGRATDERLRLGLRPLAAFGLIHAFYEWLDMFGRVFPAFGVNLQDPLWMGIRLAILAFSFLSLAAFGAYLLAREDVMYRVMLVAPLGLASIWVFGLFNIRNSYPFDNLFLLADLWTRYSIAIPSALMAAVGLINQQRVFRRAGLVSFGQDALWAAIAFGWYGIVGQLFAERTALAPSHWLNEEVFLVTFGFPVQLFRAVMAITASFFVIRFLRAFQVETDRQIARLQAARLKEAEERESLRVELYKQVVAAQESERQRIARDLHDETGQSLTAIGLGLRGLSTTIRRGDADQAVNTLRHLEAMTATSLTELQRLIADLRPSHLDDLGLPAALRWYGGQIEDRAGLTVKVETSGPEHEVESPVKIALFRVAQEALNNVIKHADATQASIQLSFELEGLRLRIRDNGRGFDPQQSRKTQGRLPFGLLGMQERAALLGGTCTVTSVLGRGTLVEIKVPYRSKNEEVRSEDPAPAGG